MDLLSTDGEGAWVLLRTGLPGSSETRVFSFRYFCYLGRNVRKGKQTWGTGREGGRSEASVIFTQLSGGLSLLEAGNNFKAVTSPCYFASRLVLSTGRQGYNGSELRGQGASCSPRPGLEWFFTIISPLFKIPIHIPTQMLQGITAKASQVF